MGGGGGRIGGGGGGRIGGGGGSGGGGGGEGGRGRGGGGGWVSGGGGVCKANLHPAVYLTVKRFGKSIWPISILVCESPAKGKIASSPNVVSVLRTH